MNVIHSFALGLKDALAPARCINCLREDSWHCSLCRLNFRSYNLSCIVCGEDSPRGLTCSDCRDETPLYGAVSAGSYQNPALRRGIHWLKFKGVRGVAGPLASLLIPRLDAIAPGDQLVEKAVLVPIPLHPRRQRKRGFNQSEDIARALSSATGIPVAELLERAKPTHTQSKLPRELRQQNTANAFSPSPLQGERDRVRGIRHLILIDDVTTSGSTLSAAATAFLPLFEGELAAPAVALREGWVGVQIWAATIARG